MLIRFIGSNVLCYCALLISWTGVVSSTSNHKNISHDNAQPRNFCPPKITCYTVFNTSRQKFKWAWPVPKKRGMGYRPIKHSFSTGAVLTLNVGELLTTELNSHMGSVPILSTFFLNSSTLWQLRIYFHSNYSFLYNKL